MRKYLSLNKEECNFLDVTRFIGIYLVIFAHFTFSYEYSFLGSIAFSFHMPLFFIISGILHHIIPFSKKTLWKIAYSLLIPYLLYNLLGFLYLCFFSDRPLSHIWQRVISTLLGENPITGASWFLLALFWAKFWALFLPSKKTLIVFSMVCVLAIFAYDSLNLNIAHNNIFMLRTALASFPFFVVGYLIKDLVLIELKVGYLFILFLLFVAGHLVFWNFFGGISLGEMSYKNLFAMYPMAILGSLALLSFSRLTVSHIACGFIKDISRGTMIIVGLHFFVMYDVFVDYIFGVMPLRYIVLWSIGLLLGFYILIKLTYNTVPILYGKYRERKVV